MVGASTGRPAASGSRRRGCAAGTACLPRTRVGMRVTHTHRSGKPIAFPGRTEVLGGHGRVGCVEGSRGPGPALACHGTTVMGCHFPYRDSTTPPFRILPLQRRKRHALVAETSRSPGPALLPTTAGLVPTGVPGPDRRAQPGL